MSNLLEASQRPTKAIEQVSSSLGYLVAASTIFHTIKEVRAEHQDRQLLPYLDDVAEVLNRPDFNYALVGGIAIDAFNDPDSTIDAQHHTVVVGSKFKPSTIRPNKTRRDLDIFVFDKDSSGRFSKGPVEEIKGELQSTVNKRKQRDKKPAPVISIVSFDEKPSLINTATLLDPKGQPYLKHGDVAQAIPGNAFELWDLKLQSGLSVSILNPWEQYWRSVTRFASGIKQKDQIKLADLATKLRTTPELAARENEETILAYRQYYDGLLKSNSRDVLIKALKEEDFKRTYEVGLRVVAGQVMIQGQKSKTLNRLVQSLPDVFDAFVGVN